MIRMACSLSSRLMKVHDIQLPYSKPEGQWQVAVVRKWHVANWFTVGAAPDGSQRRPRESLADVGFANAFSRRALTSAGPPSGG